MKKMRLQMIKAFHIYNSCFGEAREPLWMDYVFLREKYLKTKFGYLPIGNSR